MRKDPLRKLRESQFSQLIKQAFIVSTVTFHPKRSRYRHEQHRAWKRSQAVFRVETALNTGIPVRLKSGIPRRFDADKNSFETARRTVVMLAFDRPSWIRLLNKIRTFFISGQFFWRHYLNYNRFYRGSSSVRHAIIDNRVIPDRYISTLTDKLNQDEFVATLSASTSYRPGGLWQPLRGRCQSLEHLIAPSTTPFTE